jgi:hypothetical protein
MGATQSEREQNDFEVKLHALSREIMRVNYLNRPVVFDWYYNDYLYTDIRYLALITGNYELRWMHHYEFWAVSMGPVIQSRHFFRIRYCNGFYVLFDDEEAPFEGSLGTRVEELLRYDDELESVMDRVRAICAATGVLLAPQFVRLTREAKNY